jgi:hypothetical protein
MHVDIGGVNYRSRPTEKMVRRYAHLAAELLMAYAGNPRHTARFGREMDSTADLSGEVKSAQAIVRSLLSQQVPGYQGGGTGTRVRKSANASVIRIASQTKPSAEAIRVRLRASVSCMKTAITNNVFAIETPKFNMLFNMPSLNNELPALSASRASSAASTHR